MKTTKEKIAVMAHFANGGTIELRRGDPGAEWERWVTLGVEPKWDWRQNDYRIARVPREFCLDVDGRRAHEIPPGSALCGEPSNIRVREVIE